MGRDSDATVTEVVRDEMTRVEFRYTKHQVARGVRADAESFDKFFLLKNVSKMRLTYQVRLLTFRASESKKKVIIQVPKQCKIHASLRDFVQEFPKAIRIERV